MLQTFHSTDLSVLSEQEIHKLIFKDVSSSTLVGLKDRFSDEQIVGLLDHPDYHFFSDSFKDWIWRALDTIYEENYEN